MSKVNLHASSTLTKSPDFESLESYIHKVEPKPLTFDSSSSIPKLSSFLGANP